MCQCMHIQNHRYANKRHTYVCNVYVNCRTLLYQQNKSSEPKVKFWQGSSNCCKRVLEAAKLTYANKTESVASKLNLANSVFNKGKSAIPSLFSGPEVFSSASDKPKLSSASDKLRTFLKTPIWMAWVSLYLFYLLELIWNCIKFLQLPRWLKMFL